MHFMVQWMFAVVVVAAAVVVVATVVLTHVVVVNCGTNCGTDSVQKRVQGIIFVGFHQKLEKCNALSLCYLERGFQEYLGEFQLFFRSFAYLLLFDPCV